MSAEKTKPEPRVDLALFTENRRKIPWAALEPYAGQWVAISGDGTQVLTSGPDLEAVEQNLVALGIPVNNIGLERIPAEGEDTWI